MSEPWVFARLTKAHDRESFRSGVQVLDEYLRLHARRGDERDESRAFVAVRDGSTTIGGFYVLVVKTVDAQTFPKDEKVSRYPVSVMHIARFAVDERVQGQGLGRLMMFDALAHTLMVSEHVGVRAMDVVAKTPSARSFYKKFGFREMLDDELHLYLSIKAVRAAAQR